MGHGGRGGGGERGGGDRERNKKKNGRNIVNKKIKAG